MDLYHSRLTQDDLDDLIIKFKIPRDLHPWLPSKEFVMYELPDDAIVIYHQMFDFFGVRIPFSLFLLDLIKHYRTLCKQGDWFSFAKRRAPSLIYAMVWRHSDAAIDDLRPAAGSFSMADVRRLSAHVIKLRDMPKGVLVLSGLSHVWKSRVCDPILRGANGNVMGIYDFLCLPEWTGDSDNESDGDDDACVEISLVNPLRSAAVIPSSGNQGRSFTAPPAAEGPNTRDSRGMCPEMPFMWISSLFSAGPYYATYPQDGAAGNCEFTREEWDAPYRPTFRVLTKEFFKDPTVCKTMVDQFPTLGEMVRVEALSEDQLTAKMSSADSRLKGYEEKVTGAAGLELQERKKKIKSLTKSLDNLHAKVARLSVALNQATVLEAEKDEEILRLKTTPLEFASFFRSQFYDFVQKFLASDEFSRVQGELLSTAPSTGFERGLSMHRTKDEFATVLKKMANFMPGVQDRLAESSPLDARVSLPTIKESIMTPASISLEFSANVDLTASAVASEHNEEMVNAEVDGSNLKMTDDTVATKSVHAFV
ncbi:hypothetical protein Tco_1100113 [Tanacetum coccineum]